MIEAASESVQPAGDEVEQRWKALKKAVYPASRETWEHGKEIEGRLEEKSKHLRHLQETS